MSRRVTLVLLLLLPAALAGCIGGEDPGPQLGTYTIETDDQADAGGDHSGHGGGAGLQQTAELGHWNATREETFEVDQGKLGLQATWSLTTGTLTIRLVSPDGQEELSFQAADGGSRQEVIDVPAGTWTLNLTGQDATGSLELAAGNAVQMGMIQDDPITYQETLTLETSSTTWTWATTGQATLDLTVDAASGTLTVKILDGMAEQLDPIVIEGPAQVDETYPLEGAGGEWTVTLQADTFSGQVDMTLQGA